MTPYEETLLQLTSQDERIVVLTAENRAAIRSVPPVLDARFIDTGITEQTLVGMAAGLALRGRIPVAHALATFLTMRAFEFIRTDVGIPGLPVKLVGAVPGVLSEANGPTHQALEDVALMRGIPNMRVFTPADVAELVLGLPAIIRDEHPWYVRYVDRDPVVAHDPVFTIGRAEQVLDGGDVAVLVAGALFGEAYEAAQHLAATGLGVRLVNLRSLKPVDEAAILAAARETELLVTIEDHFLVGGLYSIVAEVLLRHGVTARTHPIAFEERWFRPALLGDVLTEEGLRGDVLARRIRAAVTPRTGVRHD
jgi:transketolase